MSRSSVVAESRPRKCHPKVLATLNGKRGGKGRVSPRELELSCALGWTMHMVICTKKEYPYPPYYHVDVANEWLRIAIEIDGPSHRSKWVQLADRRKARLLRSMGWTVLRFDNRDVDERLPWVLARVRSHLGRCGK